MGDDIVFIVDDEEDNRALYSELLSSVDISYRCFASAQAFLDDFDSNSIGCILLDIQMPGMNGLELQSKLRKDGIPHPIIIITGHGEISVAIEAMKMGAFDFIEKPIRAQPFLSAVRSACEFARGVIHQHHRRKDIEKRFSDLTHRESEVFKQIVEGNPNKRIADILEISTKTVEAHRAKVMQKMGTRSLAELIRASVTLQKPD